MTAAVGLVNRDGSRIDTAAYRAQMIS